MALKEVRPVTLFRWTSDEQKAAAEQAAQQAQMSLNVWLEELVNAALNALVPHK